MDKVRVLFLPAVDASSVNAQSLNVREIALRLDPARFSTTLWYECEPDPRLIGHDGIRLLRLPKRLRTAAILREMLRGYDLIAYMDYSPASYLFVHLPRILRRRTKTVLHAEAPAAQLLDPPRLLRFLYEGVVSRCDAYTGITDFVARDLYQKFGKKTICTLPVGVDTTRFMPPVQRANRSPVVLFAGTVIERKGPQLLVEAAAAIPGAEFKIVGGGRGGFENVVQQKICQLGLANVSLDGAKSQAELLEIMRDSDIFVLPSRMEGIPKVTLESAASGLPCIVFSDYETPSVVDGVTGYQVQTFDELLQALKRLIEDRELRTRMGIAARKYVEKFDWNVVFQRWQDAYLDIASVAR